MSSTTLLLLATLIGLTHTRPDTTRAQERPEKSLKQTIDKEAKEPVGDITGYYTCRGEDANGKQYTGIAMIVKKNDIYIVQWVVGLGSNFVGVGIRKGDTLAISWALGDEKRFVRGVNLYQISPGPRLSGHWATLPGDGFMQSENLTFLKKLEN
jgi:hypothetical protein